MQWSMYTYWFMKEVQRYFLLPYETKSYVRLALFVYCSIASKWTVNLHSPDNCLCDQRYDQAYLIMFSLHHGIAKCLNINESMLLSTFIWWKYVTCCPWHVKHFSIPVKIHILQAKKPQHINIMSVAFTLFKSNIYRTSPCLLNHCAMCR